jgi:hypothetical protein
LPQPLHREFDRATGSSRQDSIGGNEPKSFQRRECEPTAYLRDVKAELRLPGTKAFDSTCA